MAATIAAITPASLDQAARLLCAGELVGIPTETVYGLAADAANPQAVARIFAVKGRPSHHPVIVHVRSAADLATWAVDIPACVYRLAQAFWPGPLTFILRRAAHVADAVTGGQDTVGLRCPAHPGAQAVLRAFAAAGGSGALAAPSANRYGRISPTTAAHVAAEFGDDVPLVLDGGTCDVGIESTILDLSRGRPVLLRPGHIGADALQAVLGEAVWLPDGRGAAEPTATALSQAPGPAAPLAATPRVSGALAAHYAPRTPLSLLPADGLRREAREMLDKGLPIGVWSQDAMPADPRLLWRPAPRDAVAFARDLYAVLREFDAAELAHIFVEMPPDTAQWTAVRDRLGRAAVGSGKP